VAAAAQHLDPAPRDPLAQHAHRLGRGDGVLVTGDEERGAVYPRDIGGRHLGERLASPRVPLGILAHQRLADEGDGRRSPRPRLRREAGANQGVGDRLHVALARLDGAGADGGAGRLGRGQQRAEERQARDASGLRRREMGRDDRAHGVRDDVRALDPHPPHDQTRPVDEQRQRERTVDPAGASGSRKVEANGPVARERRQHGREGVGRPAEAVDHQHRLALALDLDGHALDEHSHLPVPRYSELRQTSQKGGSYYRQVKTGARPFYPLPDLGSGHRGRVFRRLLDEAVRLVRRGSIPSVAEVAQSAGVSRATAYRYFPSRSKLVSAVIAEALGPVRRAVPQHGDAKQRLHELLDRTYSRFAEYEPHMRAALQLALEHKSLESAGLLEEEPFRRGQRTEILATTLQPLRRSLKPRTYRRLLKALAVVYGIEPMIILKDICGATDRETETVVRWMMDALVDAAFREARTGAGRAARR
jgi:AcrR family transcriptional regulator